MLFNILIFSQLFKNKYLSLYFVSVAAFGLIYWLFGTSEHLHFNKEDNDNSNNITFLNALYFSMITQTTTGYGDIKPKSKLMRIITFIQLALLVIYIGI